MLNYHNGSWTIEIAKDCITGEIDAFVWNKSNDEGRYFLEDELETDNDINVPLSIIDKTKEMLINVRGVL
jgi:hypothetical protein